MVSSLGMGKAVVSGRAVGGSTVHRGASIGSLYCAPACRYQWFPRTLVIMPVALRQV